MEIAITITLSQSLMTLLSLSHVAHKRSSEKVKGVLAV